MIIWFLFYNWRFCTSLGRRKAHPPTPTPPLNRTGHCLDNQRKENTVHLKDDPIVFLPLVGRGQLFHSNSDQINIKEAPMRPAQSALSRLCSGGGSGRPVLSRMSSPRTWTLSWPHEPLAKPLSSFVCKGGESTEVSS